MIAVSVLVVTFALAVIYAPVSEARLVGRLTRPLAALPLSLYGLYLFIQWQDVADHESESVDDGVPVIRRWLLLAAGLFVILIAVEQPVGSVPIDFAAAVPMMGVLTLATILLFAVLRTDLSLTTGEAYLLALSYSSSSRGWWQRRSA